MARRDKCVLQKIGNNPRDHMQSLATVEVVQNEGMISEGLSWKTHTEVGLKLGIERSFILRQIKEINNDEAVKLCMLSLKDSGEELYDGR